MVERYRLRDYDDVKDAIERNKKENWLFAGDVSAAIAASSCNWS
jgi:hypothetical protein